MSTTTWSDDRVARLREHWRAGLSASEIARRMGGVSRNAVLGKLHRLGLLGGRLRPAAAPKPGRAPRVPRGWPGSRQRETDPDPGSPDLPGLVASLLELGACDCRWPIGDPGAADFRFCGRATRGAPYCPRHATIAYARREGRSRTG